MKFLSPRKLIGSALAILLIGHASAQIHLQIDWSDSSAVTFTGTGTVATNAYVGSPSGLTYEDGVTLQNFFTSNVTNDSTVGPGTPVSTTLYADSATTVFFNYLVTLDYAEGEDGDTTNDLRMNVGGAGQGTELDFDTGTAAFSGIATWDLTSGGNDGYINFWPTLGTTGTIYPGSSAIAIGTWEVVGAGSAVPEPSTYAAFLGVFALAGAMSRRRGRRGSVS